MGQLTLSSYHQYSVSSNLEIQDERLFILTKMGVAYICGTTEKKKMLLKDLKKRAMGAVVCLVLWCVAISHLLCRMLWCVAISHLLSKMMWWGGYQPSPLQNACWNWMLYYGIAKCQGLLAGPTDSVASQFMTCEWDAEFKVGGSIKVSCTLCVQGSPRSSGWLAVPWTWWASWQPANSTAWVIKHWRSSHRLVLRLIATLKYSLMDRTESVRQCNLLANFYSIYGGVSALVETETCRSTVCKSRLGYFKVRGAIATAVCFCWLVSTHAVVQLPFSLHETVAARSNWYLA